MAGTILVCTKLHDGRIHELQSFLGSDLEKLHPPHPTLSGSTPNQTLLSVKMSSWSLEATPIQCLAQSTTAANHFEHVPSKIPSRYSCSVGARNAASDSLSICLHWPVPHYCLQCSHRATLSGSLLLTFQKEKGTKTTLFFAFLYIHQPGE